MFFRKVKIMQIQESGQMYLETIFVLSKESKYVRAIDVGEHLGYSKPSVSRAVHILREDGYIRMDDEGFITLTDSGLEVAEKIFERHTLFAGILMRLGVCPETAAEDACKIEHAISDESFLAIKRHVRGE